MMTPRTWVNGKPPCSHTTARVWPGSMAVKLSEMRWRNELLPKRAVADVMRGPETGMFPAPKGGRGRSAPRLAGTILAGTGAAVGCRLCWL